MRRLAMPPNPPIHPRLCEPATGSVIGVVRAQQDRCAVVAAGTRRNIPTVRAELSTTRRRCRFWSLLGSRFFSRCQKRRCVRYLLSDDHWPHTQEPSPPSWQDRLVEGAEDGPHGRSGTDCWVEGRCDSLSQQELRYACVSGSTFMG